jgi:hypothetical protein
MKNFIRFLYRFFIKNRLIRWAWMLSLAVYGAYYASEHGIIKKKSLFSKTLFEVNPTDITTFTIRQNEEDITFTRIDSGWLAVKNNITARVKEDSLADIFNLIKKIETVKVKEDKSTEGVTAKPVLEIFLSESPNPHKTLAVYFTEKDTLSGGILSYIKRPNERLLHAVKGDWLAVLNKDFNNLRNKMLLDKRILKAKKVEFKTRLDTSVFIRNDTLWLYTDSRYRVLQQDFKNYLKMLSQLRGGIFYDASRDFKENKNIENQIIIYSDFDSTLLTAYRLSRGYVLHSSLNDDNIFKIDSLNSIYKDAKHFIQLKSKRNF